MDSLDLVPSTLNRGRADQNFSSKRIKKKRKSWRVCRIICTTWPYRHPHFLFARVPSQTHRKQLSPFLLHGHTHPRFSFKRIPKLASHTVLLHGWATFSQGCAFLIAENTYRKSTQWLDIRRGNPVYLSSPLPKKLSQNPYKNYRGHKTDENVCHQSSLVCLDSFLQNISILISDIFKSIFWLISINYIDTW